MDFEIEENVTKGVLALLPPPPPPKKNKIEFCSQAYWVFCFSKDANDRSIPTENEGMCTCVHVS